MRFRLLMLMSLWGILAFMNVVEAQEVTPPPDSPTREAFLIPLVQSDTNQKGSSVFWSPDSRYVVVSNPGYSSTEDQFAGVQYGVFEVASGQFLFSFTGFVDWMPDSEHIIMRDEDKSDAQIRDVPGGKITMTLAGAQIGWKWNPDRTQVASQSSDNNLHIYDLASDTILQTWRNIPVNNALWSDDGRLIAGFGIDGILRVYDVTSGSLKAQLIGYQALGWKADNLQLIVTPQKRSFPDQLGIWTLTSGATALFDVHNLSYLWSPDGKQLAVAGTDDSVHILDASSGRLAQKIDGVGSKIQLFKWEEADRLIIITGDYAAGIALAFEVFDPQMGSRSLQATFDIMANAHVVADQLEIIQVCEQICKLIFDMKTGEQLSEINFPSAAESFSILVSPDYKWFLSPIYPQVTSSSHEQYLQLYNMQTPEEKTDLPGYEDFIMYVSWSPDSHYFAVVAENSVRIWALQP